MSNGFNHKLYHFETTPPSKTWQEIADALDSQASLSSERLYNYKQTPQTNLWRNIEQKLEGDTRTAIILPFHRRFRQPLKYAAAVSILVLVATAITLFLGKNNSSNEVAVQPVISKTPSAPAQSPDGKNTVPDEVLQQLVSSGKSSVSESRGSESLSKSEHAKIKVNRYVTMADEDGNKVRLSKKAFTVFNCAENSTSSNYERCKEKILLMQQKMSASLLSPSGDFGGLIDMIKSLEEND